MKSVASVSQDELLAFLRRGDSYPEDTDVVEIRQTHISIVALTRSHVYKLKKPLDLGFLDFSTLEKRRQACEAEIRLNQRLCRDVYLGVLPISRRDGALRFGQEGKVIDYAVKMRRLPEEGFLDRRLARDAVTPADLDRVADKLSKFYRSQDPSAEIAEWGRVAQLRVSTDENFAQTKQFVGDLISRPAFEAIRYFTERFYEHHADLFEHRIENGKILDCHGDLHCEHVHFSGDEIHIFDCIEFNDRFRFIDVANDLAFLAMDLDFRKRRDLAAGFSQRMADALNDEGLFALLNFYKCYRAYVRGKVIAMKSLESEVPAPERETSRQNATRFFQLALSYAVGGSAPLVLTVMGRVGTGKSSIAQMMGESLGAEVFSSDRTRKELAGTDPHTRGDAVARTELYSAAITDRTYETIIRRAIECARAEGAAVLDATFGKREHREMLRERLAAAGIRQRRVELEASDDEIIRRLRQREESKTEVSDARLEDFETLSAAYDSADPLEDDRHVIVESSPSAESTFTAALKALLQQK
jgi:aminoglycoside phosphotransferase family enzyme/predicted kinase